LSKPGPSDLPPRLHREHHAKREVVVYDYVDSGVPMLARMALKRQAGYRGLGYEIAAIDRTGQPDLKR
jgi:hypothetical protein